MNVSLYQLAAEYRHDLEKLADLDLPPETVADTLESLGGELQVKAQNVVAFMRNLESTASAIKEAEIQMAARRRAIENRAASLRAYILDAMQHNNIQKIECPHFAISIAKNPPSVDIFDEAQIPAIYLDIPPPPEPKPDKKRIAQAIKAGKDIPGARLTQGVRLNIK